VVLCGIQSAMDLFSVMLVKGVVLGIWAVIHHMIWPEPEPELLDEERGCYKSAQGLLALPAPKDTTSAPDSLRALE
jgi:hypothetical protein